MYQQFLNITLKQLSKLYLSRNRDQMSKHMINSWLAKSSWPKVKSTSFEIYVHVNHINSDEKLFTKIKAKIIVCEMQRYINLPVNSKYWATNWQSQEKSPELEIWAITSTVVWRVIFVDFLAGFPRHYGWFEQIYGKRGIVYIMKKSHDSYVIKTRGNMIECFSRIWTQAIVHVINSKKGEKWFPYF